MANTNYMDCITTQQGTMWELCVAAAMGYVIVFLRLQLVAMADLLGSEIAKSVIRLSYGYG